MISFAAARMYLSAGNGPVRLEDRLVWSELASLSLRRVQDWGGEVVEVKDQPYMLYGELDLAAMASDVRTGKLHVSALNCDHPHWTSSENVTFRAWHDLGHAFTGAGFEFDDECIVYRWQAGGLRRDLAMAIWCEVVGQAGVRFHFGEFGPQLIPDLSKIEAWAGGD